MVRSIQWLWECVGGTDYNQNDMRVAKTNACIKCLFSFLKWEMGTCLVSDTVVYLSTCHFFIAICWSFYILQPLNNKDWQWRHIIHLDFKSSVLGACLTLPTWLLSLTKKAASMSIDCQWNGMEVQISSRLPPYFQSILLSDCEMLNDMSIAIK